jgi:hypothetical protein
MKKDNLLLLLILGLSLTLNIWGAGFGLRDHMVLHPDEKAVVPLYDIYNHMARQRILNPGFFIYGSGFFCLYSLPYFLSMLFNNEYIFYLLGRLFTGLMACCLIYLSYLLACRIFNKKVGLFTSAVNATALVYVQCAHYIKADIASVLFLMISFLFSFEIMRKGNLKYYVYSSVFCGICISIKYNYFGFLLLFLAGTLSKDTLSAKIKKIILAICLSIIVFFICSPFAILDFTTFKKDIGVIASQVRNVDGYWGISNINEVSNWEWYVCYFAKVGIYYPVFVSAIIGFLIYTVKGFNKENLFLIAFPLVYFIQIAYTSSIRTDRYALPLIPFISIFAGLFIWHAVEFINKRNWKAKNSIFSAGIVVLFVLPVFRCGVMDYYFSKRDTRALSGDWIIDNVPKGSKILNIYKAVDVDLLMRKGYDVVSSGGLDFIPEQYLRKGFNYIIISSEAFRMYDNYFKSGFYTRHKKNYQKLILSAKLIQEIKYPVFNWCFSDSFGLEHSSTLTVYHNPTIRIFKLKDSDKKSKEVFKVEYRAQDLMRWSSGTIVKDPDSLNNEAVYNGAVNGPYETYYKGDYIARYRVKIDDNTREDVIFGLSIYTAGRGKMLAHKEVKGMDFVARDKYQDFDLPFRLDDNYSLEIMVDYDKRCNLWIECIEIEGKNED